MNGTNITMNEVLTSTEAKSHISFYFFTKRIFDIIIGLIGILCMIPLTIIVKIAYILTGDFGHIFLKQARIGKNGKTIYIYKFRSMIENADEVLYDMMEKDANIRNEYLKNRKLKNDPRITKVGKFIRRTSIDEFPQFINVFLGNMSVVGPRPYLHREKEDMGGYYKKIITTKPGVTGYWQVTGRSNTDFITRLKMDSYYCDNKGMKMDLKLFMKTFESVIGMNGAK